MCVACAPHPTPPDLTPGPLRRKNAGEMKKATALFLFAAAFSLAACNKGNNDKGCKVEDQCGRVIEQGTNPSCTEVKCVPNACEKGHMTLIGQQICGKGAVVVPNASSSK
jgi:hypothetical protein